MKQWRLLMKFKFILIIFICINAFSISFAESNTGKYLGIMKNQGAVGHIAGNGMSWDFFIMFKLTHVGEQYRALADIKEYVHKNDQLVAIGAYKNCILLSIESDLKKEDVYQRYANASWLVSLCKVYTWKGWNHSKISDQVAFNEIDLAELCCPFKNNKQAGKKGPTIKPLGMLPIGTAQKINIHSHQEELWYSFMLPYKGFDLFFHTEDYSYKDIQKIKVTIFDTQLNRKDSWNSSQGSDGIRARYYINRGKGNEQYYIPPGKYLIRIDNNKRNINLILLLRKNEGDYISDYYKE